jgi:hypothetical protein
VSSPAFLNSAGPREELGGFEEFDRIYFERADELADELKTSVVHACFDVADIRAIDVRSVRQALLRKSLGRAEPA